MSRRFEGATVLVTGSAGGLGRSFANGFAREGAHLILADVNLPGLQESQIELQALGAGCSIHRLDLAIESEIHAFAAEITRLHPRLDVLINNAGLAYGEIARGFAELSQEKWLRYFAINTVAPLLLAQALRAPLAAGPGVIINQSSMASYLPGTAYGVTKAALNAMTYGIASSFAPDGIRVNAIAPGLMETAASRASLPPEQYDRIQSMQMIKRPGGPEDIVALGLFLASSEARFITNEIVHCDAGHAIRGFRG